MSIVAAICWGVVCAVNYRRIGGFYLGGKAKENAWYNSRGITVLGALVLYFLLFWDGQGDGLSLLRALAESLFWVCAFRLVGYDSYLDLGDHVYKDDEKQAFFMRRLFAPQWYGSFVYDFSGLFIRFLVPAAAMAICRQTAWFLMLGVLPAFIYLFCREFDRRCPALFDCLRTSAKSEEAEDPSVCRLLQKDKDLAELIIGFLSGFIIYLCK